MSEFRRDGWSLYLAGPKVQLSRLTLHEVSLLVSAIPDFAKDFCFLHSTGLPQWRLLKDCKEIKPIKAPEKMWLFIEPTADASVAAPAVKKPVEKMTPAAEVAKSTQAPPPKQQIEINEKTEIDVEAQEEAVDDKPKENPEKFYILLKNKMAVHTGMIEKFELPRIYLNNVVPKLLQGNIHISIDDGQHISELQGERAPDSPQCIILSKDADYRDFINKYKFKETKS